MDGIPSLIAALSAVASYLVFCMLLSDGLDALSSRRMLPDGFSDKTYSVLCLAFMAAVFSAAMILSR